MGITKQVSPDGAAVGENNGHAVENEKKEARVGVLRPGQGVLEEEESRTNGITEDLRNKESKDNLPFAQQSGTQMQQHQQEQSLGPIIRWERFLPVRTLKVLLVENDDSTRQVVSALLRNCSYEVTAVANGLQAWKILEDLTNHIDLVLTEVVMPCLSGIGLLDKIMNHKSCKNIPVIMMSSNDSMGTVFKCLSKGAVDFLVKPIRKNELKNLWQHVWRRCHSSSGSGSESGIQTQKSVRSKSADDSDNNSGSNDDDDDNDDNDNESSRLNARDGSDNGSGTQSSWTKRAVEIESPQRDQLVDPPDSTCAQVIHPKPENFWTDWVSTSANGECQGQKELDDDLMGKDLEIGVPKNAEKIFDSYQAEKASKLTDTKTDELLETNGKDESVNESKNLSDEPSTQAADLMGAIGATTDIRSVSRITQAPNGFSKIQEEQEKIGNASLELPSLELSLKRLRSTADGGTVAHEDRNVLRRSDQSAFTRYHTSVASNQAPAANGGSSPFESSSEAMRTESTYNMIDNPNAAPLKQGSNSSSNANDMGSTTKNVFTNQSTYKEKASTPTIKCTQNVSAFQPVQNRAPTAQQLVQEKTEDEKTATARGQSRGQHQVQVQHHHHHYHHHHLHVHNMQQQQQQQPPPPPQLDRDGLSVKNMATDVIECGSSDVFGRQVEGNATNYSVHGSNSSSNHGSNGHNGSTTAVKVGEPNIESVNGIADQYGPVGGNGSGSGSGSGVDQHRYTQREAALKKFRQKRKERNFGKKKPKKKGIITRTLQIRQLSALFELEAVQPKGKGKKIKKPYEKLEKFATVRYQSRKRLAEQRPRMRGQFVRQTAREEIGARKQRDDNNDDCNGHTCATEDR